MNQRDRSALSRRTVVGGLGAIGCVAFDRGAARAEATAVSDWAVSDHARVRLIDAGPAPAGSKAARLAGVEIELDPGYITYWRSPGEAGEAPTAAFAGSANLRRADVLYPAPSRFDEDGSEAFGYDGTVVFPLAVEPVDPTAPVGLTLGLDFAVCAKLCLPGHADLALTLAGAPLGPEAGLVTEALARVPRRKRVGEPGPLSITAVTRAAEPNLWTVMAQVGTGPAALFAEAPDGWFLQAGAQHPTSAAAAATFPLRVLSRPSDAKLAALPITMTLVTADAAIEVAADLDVTLPQP